MKKCDVSKLKSGQFMSRVSYIKVTSNVAGVVQVKNEQGVEWGIGKDIVEAECYSAHEYTTTIPLTRTELVDRFNSIGNAVYTANFNKQPKVEDAFDAIANDGELKPNKVIRKLLAEKMKGEERTLIGYTISRDISLGRSMVVELDNPPEDRIRQVDHRSLNWFICMGTRYEVKGTK